MSARTAIPEPEPATRPAASVPAAVDPLCCRRTPSRWQSIALFVRTDLVALGRSWLCRGFFAASLLVTVLELKGMQAGQKAASQMLETVYITYLLVWMHAIIFIAGAALVREADCLNDAILSRGVTRGEYILGKLIARMSAVALMLLLVLLPASIWAIRQDKLVRTEDGFVNSVARGTKVEAWDPKKVFAEVAGTITEMTRKVGDFVRPGDVLARLDDRALFDELESERRTEENARNDVVNGHRKVEQARRNVAQAEDAVERAERSLVAKDLLSKAEQADRQADIRARKRDLGNAESELRIAEAALAPAERAVENALAKVRDVRRRLALAVISAPLGGYVTEIQANPGQYFTMGSPLFTISPLDEYQIKVPVFKFDEFKRLTTNLTAYIKIGETEYKGSIERLGVMTQPDRWGRDYNHVVVRFKGDGTMGMLGMPADVRLVLPPPKEQPNRAAALLNVLTGRKPGEAATRTTSVTVGWMCVGLGKILGTACLLTALTFLVLVLFRNALVAILGIVGLYHISNLLFDFVGLKDLSYLEMAGTMEKVLGGIAKPADELSTLAWFFGLAALFAVLTTVLFVSRDPQK